jgi:hypothetical protein
MMKTTLTLVNLGAIIHAGPRMAAWRRGGASVGGDNDL